MSEVVKNTEFLNFRKNYSKIKDVAELPNLIEVQKKSYKSFFDPQNISNENGLGKVFTSVFPVNDFTDLSTIEFVSYRLEKPKYSQLESIKRGVTYAATIKVTFRLIVWLIDDETGSKEVKSIKEQEVFFGEIPLMTEKGTFITNGTERVVVSQLHRSPGAFFEHDKGKATHQTKLLYSARIIPYRGSWLDFEFDTKDLLHFRIDRRRKVIGTVFLKALGLTDQDIFDRFYTVKDATITEEGAIIDFDIKILKGSITPFDIISANDKKIKIKKDTKVTSLVLKKLANDDLSKIIIKTEDLLGFVVADNYQDVFKAGEKITEENINKISSLPQIKIFSPYLFAEKSYIYNTFATDKTTCEEEALIEIYKILRPGDPPSVEAAREVFTSLFFNFDRYDLSPVGRMKLNERLDMELPEEVTLLTKEDVIRVVEVLIEMKQKNAASDDIDHLGNRRVRSVGELVENQFRIGLVRVQRAIQERMNSVEIDAVLPQDLINVKLLVAILREFFGTSQLSQFMSQTNPLAEITHKRRLSALGPGGLARDRAGFEVRDVHTSHYGRICPIETPEGQNIGLISSIASYAKINEYGFIESPYRKVENGIVSDEIHYLSATKESGFVIAQANEKMDENGKLIADLHNCRFNGDYMMFSSNEINYIDVSPKQLVSVAAALIPFLENDDANRALMGSNMQKQAVPLLYNSAPIIGTGMEKIIAKDSSACVVANSNGIVEKVDSLRIMVRVTDEDSSNLIDIYELEKYQRSNQDTCINQKPIVKLGQEIKKGDILADGQSTKNGELALGKNVLVGFMSWNGYNFEDSIIISEKLVRDDVFTSVHIEKFEITTRDTRLGAEEITRDIPNVSEESLRHTDEVGIVNVGSEVSGGDVLVGKVTPKSETPATPEEKLLRAIFGEKAYEIKDSSLYVPPGVKGTVVDVRVFTRRGVEKDERAITIERQKIAKLTKDKEEKIVILEKHLREKIEHLFLGNKLVKALGKLKSNHQLKKDDLSEIKFANLRKISIEDNSVNSKIEALIKSFDTVVGNFANQLSDDLAKLQSGDDLPQGVLKYIKVFVAVKKTLKPGDKMAGRHGNKGVVSKIVAIEDMPYLEDGTSLDILLNPLGVPSRMNVGQILETHLGLASYKVGRDLAKKIEQTQNEAELEQLKAKVIKIYNDQEIADTIKDFNDKEFKSFAKHSLKKGIAIATPVFDGAKENDIVEMYQNANLETDGKMWVYDGKTGERFDRRVTVGYIYMLKLHHLVDDKIHARSVGPYSLVTQQPLGGKSHFGGQRFGEMECWALQAYGASFTLQEMLTVKSDDVTGRLKLFEAVVKGESDFEYSVPESFNVMIKELKSLCLNVNLELEN